MHIMNLWIYTYTHTHTRVDNLVVSFNSLLFLTFTCGIMSYVWGSSQLLKLAYVITLFSLVIKIHIFIHSKIYCSSFSSTVCGTACAYRAWVLVNFVSEIRTSLNRAELSGSTTGCWEFILLPSSSLLFYKEPGHPLTLNGISWKKQ